jgi:hypothetical protein
MEKKFFLLGVAVLLSASLFFLGCPTDDGTDDPVKSDNASVTEASVTVKGKAVTWATGKTGADFASAVEGSVTLDVDGAAVFAYAKPEGATAKAVLSTTELADEAAFNGKDAFADGAISGGTSYLYLKVTAEDEKTVKWYKITVTVTNEDITTSGGYTVEQINSEANTLTIASVWKNVTTGVDNGKVTIKLTGTYPANTEQVKYVYYAPGNAANTSWKENVWGYSIGVPKKGAYGDVTIKGLFPKALTLAAIKNTSPGLLFYKGDTGTAQSPLTAPAAVDATGSSATYFPANDGNPIRWRLYENIPINDTFTVLLYDGGSAAGLAKSLTLEIAEYNAAEGQNPATEKTGADAYKLTATIDYSAVVFPSEPTEDPETPDADN